MRPLILCSILLICTASRSVKGQVWQNMGSGFGTNYVADFHIYSNEIYACGPILFSGTTTINGIAKWNGASWLPLASGTNAMGAPVFMETFNGNLIAAGNFQNMSGVPGTKGIASWDGNAWNNLNNGITSGTVNCMAVFNGELYVGGNILTVDSMQIKDIAKWDGTAWHPVCTLSLGLTTLFCMTVFNNDLYIGGYFSSVNGSPAFNIAKYDGTVWSDVGGGIGGDVFAMVGDTINNRLYVSGNITNINNGSTPCPSNVAFWDGVSWNAVGNGPNLYPKELIIFKNELYTGFGSFPVNNSGDTLKYIAKWDGTEWQKVGGGLNCSALAFLPNGNDLIVGGCFSQAGDSTVNLVAVWKDTLVSIMPNIDQAETIKIVPNPFSNTAYIELPLNFQSNLPLIFKLKDTNGKIVLDKFITELTFEINRNTLTSGIYIFTLNSKKGQIHSGKVIIE